MYQEWWSVAKVLRQYAAVFGFLMTVVIGGYLAAAVVNKDWVFWVCVPAAFIITLVGRTGKTLGEYLTRFRNYPGLLAAVGESEAKAEQLAADLAAAQRMIRERYLEGIQEGRAEASGAVFSLMSNATLVPTGIAMVADELRVFANVIDGNVPLEGARFDWVFILSTEIKGTLQVVSSDLERASVVLACSKRVVPAFWDRLENDAVVSSKVPEGLELRPAAMIPIEAHQLEAGSADGN
jgi:hypothetical protein